MPRLALVVLLVCTACQERPVGPPPELPHQEPAPAVIPERPVPTGLPLEQAVLESALLPAAVTEFRALPLAPLLQVEARLDPQIDRLVGRQRLWLPNPSDQALTTVALRCPANAKVFRGAGLTITCARWDGVELGAPLMSADGTGFTWTLPWPLAVGAVGCLEMEFAATVSRTGGFHGLMARSGSHWCLYHWHPELAGWRDGAWQLPPVTGIGDESQTPLAHVVARLTVPAGGQVIAGGREDARQAADPGWETVTIAAPECRNLAVAITSGLVCSEALAANGVRVRSWTEPAHPNARARALRVAVASLDLHDRSFGPYPFNELDVVETAQGDDVGGMESSGLVFIDRRAYAMTEHLPADAPLSLMTMMLEEAVAHEVGHQWWYGIVGNDAFADPWLDESLTNWSGGWVLEHLYGPAGRSGCLKLCLMGMPVGPADLVRRIDLPLSGFHSMDGDYGPLVYGRGALMYEALRLKLGDQRFLAWLRTWAERHRFRTATPADWQAAVETALGPGPGRTFARLWLRGEGLTRRTLRDPLAHDPRP